MRHQLPLSHTFPHLIITQEDREIQEILMRERGDFDAYLQAAGALPVHSLLPPAAAAASQAAVREEEEQGVLEQGDHPLAGLVSRLRGVCG